MIYGTRMSYTKEYIDNVNVPDDVLTETMYTNFAEHLKEHVPYKKETLIRDGSVMYELRCWVESITEMHKKMEEIKGVINDDEKYNQIKKIIFGERNAISDSGKSKF